MATRRSNLLANVLWLPALAVGALQMYRVQAGVITSHGADFFGPIALYASLRAHGTDPLDIAAYVLGVALAFGAETLVHPVAAMKPDAV